MSGDGPNMNGRSLEAARGDALEGFTINALSIRRPGGRPADREDGLEDYYARTVIGGPAPSWRSRTKRGPSRSRPGASC